MALGSFDAPSGKDPIVSRWRSADVYHVTLFGGLFMKRNLKNIVWLGVPLLLVVGCAENRRDASVSYSPALTESVPPTSDRDVFRSYPDTQSSIDFRSPPPGANSQDW